MSGVIDGRDILKQNSYRKHYQTLQYLFSEIYLESAKHGGQHSPYSIGTFDDDDE